MVKAKTFNFLFTLREIESIWSNVVEVWFGSLKL